MPSLTAIGRKRRRALGSALLLGAAGVLALAPAPAQAHFILMAPDSWMSQDSVGLPEKLGPCGNEGGGTATGKVTAFHPGETISVTIDEVIPHPGHYRVALAVNDRSELPPEPLVTPAAGDPCDSATIESPPIFPILADNQLPHTQPFTVPQTFTVTLPANVTCTKCTLQVLEFMSSHGAPCFYHHCADISIQAQVEAPTATPGNTPTPTVPPTPSDTPSAGECGGITEPKLTIGKLSTPPGDETLIFKGTLTLPSPVSPALNPLGNGFRLRVDRTTGTVLDVTIPGGAGWRVNRSATKWSYWNPGPTPPGGIYRVIIEDKSAVTPGLVRFAVNGRAQSYAVAAADLPMTARMIIAPSGGQCADANFPSCAFNASGSMLKCK